jgi:hypothetical protein
MQHIRKLGQFPYKISYQQCDMWLLIQEPHRMSCYQLVRYLRHAGIHQICSTVFIFEYYRITHLLIHMTGSSGVRISAEFYLKKFWILLICDICKSSNLSEFQDIHCTSGETGSAPCSDLPRNFIQGPIPASWASLPVFNLYVLCCPHHIVTTH